jgi:hypothetical protein
MYPAHNGWQFSMRWLFIVMTLLASFLVLVLAVKLSLP